MTLSSMGDLKKNNEVNLHIEFENEYEGEIKIVLPNSLRLAPNYNRYGLANMYYLRNNKIDYITYYKTKECKTIDVPLIINYEGNYKFESIVCNESGKYHISNSLELNIN